jgi:NitT/TauT family transport system substrate-binding protein
MKTGIGRSDRTRDERAGDRAAKRRLCRMVPAAKYTGVIATAVPADAKRESAGMRRSKGISAAGVLATVLAMLAASLDLSAAQSSWRHGVIEAKSDAGILFMASKRDFAGRLGLRLDFVQLKNDAIALKALLAGELDSYEGGAGGAIVAASRGADVRIVGCYWLAAPHGVYVRSNIAAMADLKGRAVAVSTPGTFPEIFARAAFEKAGIAISDIRLAAMGSDTDRYKALIAGVVDGAIITNEFVPLAGQNPIHDLMPATDVMPNFMRLCIQMTGKTLAQRHDAAIRFIAAEIDGLRFAMSHRDETVRLTHEITGMKPDDPRPAFVYDEAIRTKVIAPDLPIPMDKLDFMQKQLVGAGNLARPSDLDKMVDTRAREEALALLAK